MNIGKRITDLREKQGLTTNKLANLSGLSQSFIRSVELGEKGITVESLEEICRTLKITIRDFFDVDNSKKDADMLTHQISLLTTEQKMALGAFLKTISPSK